MRVRGMLRASDVWAWPHSQSRAGPDDPAEARRADSWRHERRPGLVQLEELIRCGASESAHARAGRGGAGYHVRRSYRVEFTRRSHVKMSWRSGVPPSSVCPQRFRSLRALGIAPPSLAHRLPLLRAPALQRGWLARRPKEETDTAESTPPGWVDLERAVEEIP